MTSAPPPDRPAFYDVHCHALTLSHPSFLAFGETLRFRRSELIRDQIRSPDYLARALLRSRGEGLRNMLAVMERSPGAIFALMEDDLVGGFAREGDPPPLVRDGTLRLAGREWGAVAICPLIVDFEDRGAAADVYYARAPAAAVEAQIRDVLLGVRDYRIARPGGLLRVLPFLGVNPRNHSSESLCLFLAHHLADWRPGRERAAAVFAAMGGYSSTANRLPGAAAGESLFAGVKLYPPLGFDPWPDEGEEREKVEILYGFCEARGIPIVTHCDDHGFRVVPQSEAFAFTAPARFRPALARFPRLRIDFAHLGRQYTTTTVRLRWREPTAWFDEILALIDAHPNVYADVSFNGVEPEYYERLAAALAALPAAAREKVEARLLFGSDFPVNLSKVRSYADYYRIFDAAPLAADLRARLASENAERFLFGG